jgi:hypothetical protein
MWVAQWVIAVAVVLGVIVAVVRTDAWGLLGTKQFEEHEDTASVDLRKTTWSTLMRESPKLESFETSEFLLGIAVALYEKKDAALDVLDDKAQKLVTLIGGGATLFALLGGFTDSLHAALTPLLVLAALCFFGSLAFALLSLRPRDSSIPTITQYNSPKLLEDPNSRAKIARQLIETWEGITLELTPVLQRKGLAIFLSSLLVVVGASVLLANFLLIVGTKRETGAQHFRCWSSVVLRRPNRLTLTCEEQKK